MKSKTIIDPTIVFGFLCLAFVIFSLTIYFGSSKPQIGGYEVATRGGEGRLIWQKYNCQSCHQVYGLGGYLGPDLTNVYSKYDGNKEIMSFFFKGGIKQMPKFSLTKKEENQLIDFFKFTDASGSADPRKYKTMSDGMIEQDGKGTK